jgi:hypothetical protein
VPFWFVPAEAVLDAMQDGELTIGAITAAAKLRLRISTATAMLRDAPIPTR